jgi:hypothetical protein
VPGPYATANVFNQLLDKFLQLPAFDAAVEIHIVQPLS